MIENNPINVSTAFEMLLEEVEAEIEFVNNVGAKAFEAPDYDKAKEALEHAGSLTNLRDRVADLHKEWDELAAVAERQEDEQTKAERRDLGRLRRGLRTPESEYYRPILRVLTEMGGSGQVAEVLDRVGEAMKPVLKDVDYDPLASSPDLPRWRNAAQWARNSMVKEGLLKADSPRGVWEISERGRDALEQMPAADGASRKETRESRSAGRRGSSARHGFTHKAVVAYSFNGRRHEVRTFKEVLLGLCTLLSRMHKSEFAKVLTLRGRTRAYFSKNRRGMAEARKIEGTNIYAETNLSANDIITRCHEVLKHLGHDRDELQVEARKR